MIQSWILFITYLAILISVFVSQMRLPVPYRQMCCSKECEVRVAVDGGNRVTQGFWAALRQ